MPTFRRSLAPFVAKWKTHRLTRERSIAVGWGLSKWVIAYVAFAGIVEWTGVSLEAAGFAETRLRFDARHLGSIPSSDANAEPEPFGFFNTQQEFEMDHLLPERWLRPLTDRGIDYVLIYSAEALGNVRGGLKRGTIFSGALEAGVAIETEKQFGWQGATLYASSLVSHGQSLSDHHLGDLYGGSSIESESSLRLYELWLDQTFFHKTLSLRVGQLAADREFLGTDVATLFMNAVFGWPAVFGVSVDAPAYPVAAPGVRLRIDMSQFWIQSAIFTGKIEPKDSEGEALDGHGVYLNFNGGALAIWEAGYSTATEEKDSRYPGVYKLGAWLHTGSFADQYHDDIGLSLADPFSSQNPRTLKNNWGLYAVAEQKIWLPANAVEEQGLSIFARVGGAPSDRNLITLSVDSGLHYVGLLPSRPNDVTGLAISYNRISNRARSLLRDDNIYAIPPAPLPDYESVLELTHRIEIKPWWYVQPDLQYIIHPGGSREIPDALVIGFRSTLSF